MDIRSLKLGPYQPDERIGAGGMAEVWSARGEPRVALKLLSVAAAEVPRLVRAVRTEVRIAAGLCSPYVGEILDTGEVQVGELAVPWVALERAEGSLADTGAARDVDVLEVLTHVLRGLAHAHARGVLHRDVKPGNVLRLSGRWLLSDFGLATTAATGVLRGGSPGFAAPEQVRGEAWAEGPWTDLYAVGALAWALVTGLTPTQPSDLRGGDLPPQLAEWVAQASAYAPGGRFRHAMDALAALPTAFDGGRLLSVSSGDATSATRYDLLDDAQEGSVWAHAAPPRPRHQLPRQAPADPLKATVQDALRPLVSHPLPGQERAREAIWAGLLAADAGERSVVVLEGQPGSGRHELIARVLAAASECGAAQVVRLRASPTRPAGAEQLARESLGARDASPAECQRVAELWDVSTPGLAELLDPDQPRLRLHTLERQYQALGAVLEATSGGRILVVAVEEAQHALDVLLLAVDGLQALPARTLVLFTTGGGEGSAARSLLDQLPTPVRMEPVVLEGGAGEPLPWRDALDVALGLSAPAERLERLPVAVRGVLEAAALLGGDVDESMWVEVCEAVGLGDPRDAMPALLAAGWVEREGRERWLLRSEALRRAVLEHIALERRREVHLAAVAVLERGPASRALAEHHLALGERRAAARAWYSAYGDHIPLRLLTLQQLQDRISTDPPDTVTALVWFMQAHIASLGGQEARAFEFIDRLGAHLQATGDPTVATLYAFLRGWHLHQTGSPQMEAMVDSQVLVRAPPDFDDWWPTAQLTLLQASMLSTLGRRAEAAEEGARAVALARTDSQRIHALTTQARFELSLGHPEVARQILEEVGRWTHVMTGSMRSVYHQVCAFADEQEGDLEQAARQTGASIAIRDEMGLASPAGRINHAVYLAQLGRLEEARARLAELDGDTPMVGHYLFVVRLRLAAADGDLALVRDLLDHVPDVLTADLAQLAEDAADALSGQSELAERCRELARACLEAAR